MGGLWSRETPSQTTRPGKSSSIVTSPRSVHIPDVDILRTTFRQLLSILDEVATDDADGAAARPVLVTLPAPPSSQIGVFTPARQPPVPHFSASAAHVEEDKRILQQLKDKERDQAQKVIAAHEKEAKDAAFHKRKENICRSTAEKCEAAGLEMSGGYIGQMYAHLKASIKEEANATRLPEMKRQTVKDAFVAFLKKGYVPTNAKTGPKNLLTPLEEDLVLCWCEYRRLKNRTPVPLEIRSRVRNELSFRFLSIRMLSIFRKLHVLMTLRLSKSSKNEGGHAKALPYCHP